MRRPVLDRVRVRAIQTELNDIRDCRLRPWIDQPLLDMALPLEDQPETLPWKPRDRRQLLGVNG